MTEKSIDLLRPDEIVPPEGKKTAFSRTITIFLLVFYSLALLAIFSFGLVVNRESQVVAKKIDIEKAKLDELREVEMLQMLLKQRLSSLIKVIETDRLDPKEWLDYLDSLVPEGVALESVKWELEGQVNLSGKAGNALALSSYLDNVKNATDEQKIAQGILASASRDPEGSYSFNLEILIREQ
jgi:Tfp pilus assembly protein PilN